METPEKTGAVKALKGISFYIKAALLTGIEGLG